MAISPNGKEWFAALELENDADRTQRYSYPAVVQTRDGLVHIAYTWRRERIKHVVADPTKLSMVPIVSGKWPKLE